MKELFIVLFCIFTVLSVVLFKWGHQLLGFKFELSFLIKWILHPIILISLILAFSSRLMFYKLLDSYGVSIAYMITAISFPLIIFAAFFIFQETLTKYQVLGSLLIFLGVFLIGK